MVVKLARIGDANGLRRIAAQWGALVDRTPGTTPFGRPEWLLPWWDTLGSGELHALTFREDGRLAGLLILFIHEWEGWRQVTLAGNGITDYLGMIVDRRLESECANLAFGYLHDIRDRWDLCDWQDLRSGSPLLGYAPKFFNPAIEPCVSCTNAPLPSDFAAYEGGLSHGLRRTIRIAMRRLEREGSPVFGTVREDPDGQVLGELFRLHETRWASRGGPSSMFDRLETQRFLAAAARGFAALEKLMLFTMRSNGELAAIICALLDRNRAWGYITGMDPAFSRFSPGNLLLHYAMREAIAEGARSWEFLRGDEPYKFLWGARRVPKFRMRLWHLNGCAPDDTRDESVHV